MKKIYILLLTFFYAGYTIAQQTDADNFFQLGNYSKAIAAYTTDTTKAYNQRMIAKSYQALENYGLAITHYKKAIALDSTVQLQKFELAKLYYQTKKFEESAKLYGQLIEEDSNNPTFFYLLGLSLENMGKSAAAYQCYQQAYTIDANYLKASYQIAKAALLNNMYEECKKYIDAALDKNPDNADFVNLLAFYYYKKNDYENAIPWLEKLVSLSQASDIIYWRLGYCYYKKENYNFAIENFEKQKTLDPYNPSIFYYIGVCYQKLHYYKKAEKSIQDAIVLKQERFDEEYITMAEIYQSQKKYKNALEYYQLALEEETSDFLITYKIAVTADKITSLTAKQKLAYYKEANEQIKLPVFQKLISKRIDELTTEIEAKAN